MKTMKTLCLALAIAGSLWASTPGAKNAKTDIVAQVNGEPVTSVEFQRMVANPLTLLQLQQELGVEAPDSKAMEELALRKLIHRRLILQEAVRRNLTVTEEELDAAVASLRHRFEDLKSFGAWLQRQGLEDKLLFDTVRADILADRVWAVLVESARISDEEAQQYYEQHQQELSIGEEARLRIIAVDSETAAEEILAALRQGAAFDRLARRRSLGLRAAKGGDAGWVDLRTLPQELQQAVATLKPGQAVGPVHKSTGEFLIVGLQARRPLRAKSLAEARSEIEQRLLPAKRHEIVQAWLAEQEKKSTIEVFPPALSKGNKSPQQTGREKHAHEKHN